MSSTEGIKMKPSSPLSCVLEALTFSLTGILLGYLVLTRRNHLSSDDMLLMSFIFSSILMTILAVVALGHGFGSNDEKFVFLIKGKQSPLMRVREIYFNEIREVLLIRNRKGLPIHMRVTARNKIYYLGQWRVIDRFLATLSAKNMGDKIREVEEDISPFRHFRYWWKDGEVEDRE